MHGAEPAEATPAGGAAEVAEAPHWSRRACAATWPPAWALRSSPASCRCAGLRRLDLDRAAAAAPRGGRSSRAGSGAGRWKPSAANPLRPRPVEESGCRGSWETTPGSCREKSTAPRSSGVLCGHGHAWAPPMASTVFTISASSILDGGECGHVLHPSLAPRLSDIHRCSSIRSLLHLPWACTSFRLALEVVSQCSSDSDGPVKLRVHKMTMSHACVFAISPR